MCIIHEWLIFSILQDDYSLKGEENTEQCTVRPEGEDGEESKSGSSGMPSDCNKNNNHHHFDG